MIFMTSNLGATEMGSILRPSLGFATSEAERLAANGVSDDNLNAKVGRAGVEAARRKFTPEFMNRIDKVVVFRSLGAAELSRILSIELGQLQQRIFNSPGATPFVFNVTAAAREFLLSEGTDMKYGARHLKRAIERSLVHPLSNLIASGQVHGGDLLLVDYEPVEQGLSFVKEGTDMPVYEMIQMIDSPQISQAATATASTADYEQLRVASAKSPRR
jgi:ATP-dependent Clp protease ATP-binding subunit ClpA